MTKLSSEKKIREAIIVEDDADQVYCDGGHASLGHPIVWYSFDGRDNLCCSYCDREFVKKSAAQ